jgi:DNA-directed RNA polymerase subunit RPC12/RpoP
MGGEIEEVEKSSVGNVEEEPKEYICLNCGHRFFSADKHPKCPVCQRRRVIPFSEFKTAVLDLAKKDPEVKSLIADEVLSEEDIRTILHKYEPELEKLAESDEGDKSDVQDTVSGSVVSDESGKSGEAEIKKSVESPKDKIRSESKRKGSRSQKSSSSFGSALLIIGGLILAYFVATNWDWIKGLFFGSKSQEVSASNWERPRGSSSVASILRKNLGGW